MPDPYNYTQGFQQPNLVADFTRGMQLGEMAQQRELERLKMQQAMLLAEQKRKEQEAMQGEVLSVAENPTLDGIRKLVIKHPALSAPYKEIMSSLSSEQSESTKKQAWNVFSALQSGRKDIAIEILGKSEQAARNSGLTAQADGMKLQRELLEKAETGEAGDKAVLLGAGTFLASVDPENYDKYVKSQLEAAKAPAEIKIAEAKAKFALETVAADLNLTKAQTNKVLAETNKLDQETRKMALEAENAKANGGLTTEKRFDFEDKLRKEYTIRSKGMTDAQQTMSIIKSSAADGSGAGDLALVTAFMKMLDPGSVVRESEFANARDTAGLLENLKNQAQKLQKGSFLDPSQRASFTRLAGDYLKAAEVTGTKARSALEKVVKSYGLSSENVFGTPAERTVTVEF